MDEEMRKRLEAAGWRVGGAEDLLDLSPKEIEFIETKLALARGLRRERERQGLTQQQVADRIGSSQSRVARMEAADSSVSMDLLVRSLLTLGVDREELAALVKPGPSRSRSGT